MSPLGIDAGDAALGTASPPSGVPQPALARPLRTAWAGQSYYGRPQLKPAPFDAYVVGGYIFLAGLSGSSSLLAAIGDAVGGEGARSMGRRGRMVALLAPTVGSALLIWDLHTPKRFYNMLRVAKGRSPMSIGTWILMAFSASAFPAALAGALESLWPQRRGWAASRALASLPAAASGAGLSFYTASLLAATSTPLWAAAPRAMAVRFAASSIASASAALRLGESEPGMAANLEALCAAALAVELAAGAAQEACERRAGVARVHQSRWGQAQKIVSTALGAAAPLALFAGAWALRRRSSGDLLAQRLSVAASAATLLGSAFLRVSALKLGDQSASDPEISLRFAQPDNLPPARRRRRR